jgi:hypothetical protein
MKGQQNQKEKERGEEQQKKLGTKPGYNTCIYGNVTMKSPAYVSFTK